MEEKNKRVIIISIVALALVLITASYAYFSARITGLESASTISMTAGRMGIEYAEGDENVTASNIYPKEEAWIEKTFTLTGYNTTNIEMKYDIWLNVEVNGFANNYLTYDLEVLEATSGKTVSEKTNAPINGTGKIKFGTGTFINADGDKHKYKLSIYFKDNGNDQNDAQGAVFNAKVYVSEYEPKTATIALTNENSEEVQTITSYTINKANCLNYITDDWEYTSEQEETYCTGGEITVDGETYSIASDLHSLIKDNLISNNVVENIEYVTETKLKNDTEYIDGQYTYYYNQNRDEWAVQLTDKESTAPVTTELLSSINDRPIANMSRMFYNSRATSIDLSSFDTSNVTDMSRMFYNSDATSIDLSSFDTSNVTDMTEMFKDSRVTNLDISNFDLTGKDIKDILSSYYIQTVEVKDENAMDLICTSGEEPYSLQFKINGEVITRDNCVYRPGMM